MMERRAVEEKEKGNGVDHMRATCFTSCRLELHVKTPRPHFELLYALHMLRIWGTVSRSPVRCG